MKRYVVWSVLLALAAAVTPALLADVKTREKTQFKLEGVLGGVVRMFGGSAARDGITQAVAVKGNRRSEINDTTGTIIDLGEEKLYQLDVKKKEYQVKTFAELREAWKKAQADAEKQRQQMKPEEKQQVEEAGTQLEFTADVKETGQQKNIAGHDTRQVILTITGHEKGRKIEESGGFVMTNDMWLASKIPALDEVAQFHLRFAKAVYGENFAADLQQMAGAFAMYPSMKPMMEQLQSRKSKLQGTALMTTTTFDGVKSPEQMKQAQQQQQSSGGGGLGGLLAKKMMGNKGPVQPRTTILTTVHELLSLDLSASDADVAMPAGFKEKK